METEREARLITLSKNQKDLQTQVARIKQTIEKVLDKDTSLAERICTSFRERGIKIISVLTVFSVTIATITLAITSLLGECAPSGSSPRKDEWNWKKWLNRLDDALKRLVGRADEALPAIVRNAVGAILRFLGKTVGFAAKHKWILLVFAAGLIGVWLMQKVSRLAVQGFCVFVNAFVLKTV